MSTLLTAAELDALRSSAADAARGRKGAEPVERYNFRRPDRITKEQMHALNFLHERCARNMSTSFSAYLRTTITLSVSSVDQLAYDEFLRTVADPTAFYALGIAPFDELGALEINPAVAFALVDRLLGGAGHPAPVTRPLTEIEQNVVDSIVKLLLEGLAEAWKPVTNLAFSIRARETRPQMLQVAAPNEGVVVVVFHVQVGDVSGMVNLCIPAGVVETASAQFVQAWPKQRRDVSAQERAWITEHLARVPVPVMPMIRTTLPASAVLALQPGEVLSLPLPADRPLDVYVGGLRKLTGRLASERGRLMVMVEEQSRPAAAGADGEESDAAACEYRWRRHRDGRGTDAACAGRGSAPTPPWRPRICPTPTDGRSRFPCPEPPWAASTVWFDRASAAAYTRAVSRLEETPSDEAIANLLTESARDAAAAVRGRPDCADVLFGDPAIGQGRASAGARAFYLAVPNLASCVLAVGVARSPAALPDDDRWGAVLDVDLPLTVRFGRTVMPLHAIAELGPGSIIDMGRSPDEPVDVLVGERLIARGEVVVVGGNYGVRITQLVAGRETAGADREARTL